MLPSGTPPASAAAGAASEPSAAKGSGERGGPERRSLWSGDAVALLAAFVLFTIPVAFGATDGLDRKLTALVQGWPLDWLRTNRQIFIDWPGSALATGVVTLVVAATLVRRRPAHAWAICVAFAATVVVEVLLKSWLSHPGVPSAGFDSLLGQINSYPSGHAARTTFLAVTLAGLAPRPAMRLLLAAGTLLVTLGLVYLGYHWTSDVVAGALLGYAAAATAREGAPYLAARG